ncbi:MAG: protein translocase subunit SecF [Candidatus Humimicrobiaceae bacterium]
MNQRKARFDFIGKRKIWFTISLIVVLIGVAGYFIQGGFNFGIDFLGGSLIEVEFDGSTDVGQIRDVLEDTGYGSSIIQQTDDNKYIIRIKAEEIGKSLEIEEKARILDALDEGIGINPVLLQDRTVNPGFGSILIRNALIAMAVSLAGILIYVWIRFEFRFGATAIVTLAHDVLVTLGVYAILNREINTSTIAALLTIIGYSLNDTIVVFDRIRENTPQSRSLGYANVVNQSVNMTLSRSINTSITSLFPVILLLILGTTALKDFALALTVGIISGTYSSIFFASPLLVVWNNRFSKYKK